MTYPGLSANWVDGTTQFHAANENAVEIAVDTLSAFSTKTANYTFSVTDQFIAADATAGPIIQTLPSAVGIAGKAFIIEKVDSTVNTVTVATTSSQTIDGSASALLVFTNQRVGVMSTGTNWMVTASNYAGATLGYAELLTSFSTSNSAITDAALVAAKIPCLALTTIGVGRPVTITFQGQAYNSTANDYAGVQLLINNSAVGGTGAAVSSPAASPRAFSFHYNHVLTLGTSYTFEIGSECQSGSTGQFYADNTTPLPMFLSVVGQ